MVTSCECKEHIKCSKTSLKSEFKCFTLTKPIMLNADADSWVFKPWISDEVSQR